MLELTAAQQEIYLEGRLFGEVVNNIGGYQKYPCDIDVVRFRRARERVLGGNDAYQLRFRLSSGRCEPFVVDDPAQGMPLIDLSSVEAAREAALTWIQRHFETPFADLGAQVFEDALIRVSAGEYWYYAKAHHLIMDGWGFALQMRRILHEYAKLGGEADVADEGSGGFPSFVQYMRQHDSHAYARHDEDRAYWMDRFCAQSHALFAPSLASSSQRVSAVVRPDLFTSLKSLAAHIDVPVTTIFYAALYVYFSRVFQSDQVTICSPVHNRRNAFDKEVIGSLVNVNAHCLARPSEPGFTALARHIAQLQSKDYRHSRLPLGEIVRELRHTSGLELALHELSFNYQKLDFDLSIDGHPVLTHYLSHNHERGALTFVLCDYGTGQEMLLHLDYNTSCFSDVDAQATLLRILGLLEQVVAKPSADLNDYDLLTPQERHQQIASWSGVDAPMRLDICLHEFFEEQAERFPERIAIRHGQQELSYRDLDERANILAHYLIAHGAQVDGFVGVCHGRSIHLLVAILAVLKAGSAYVPIDPAYPKERALHIFKDAGLDLLLVDEVGLVNLRDQPATAIDVEGFFSSSQSKGLPATRPGRAATGVGPGNLAYVIYTSGSTGQPKGVLIEHSNASMFVQWALATYDEEDLRVVLAGTSICFDLSIFELFVPLACGGQIALADNVLALQAGTMGQVSLINTVPSAIQALLEARAVPKGVRCINLAGEPLRQELVEALHASCDIKLYDLYGPSETTTYSTFATRHAGGRETIGRPIANTRVYVLDPAGNLLPQGAIGELHIGGAGVARGYLNRPELTEERFVFSRHANARLYRTGDLVRFLEDGSLQYIGRKDNQIKLRGYRIELGEIEACLLLHPDVGRCAVMVRDDAGATGGKSLVAYVVAASDARNLDRGALAGFVAERLPAYMVPAVYVVLAALPLTPNGKVDRKALPAPSAQVRLQNEHVSPATAIERRLCAQWTAVLGIDRIGVTDNFFALGGDSLSLLTLAAGIDAEFCTHIDAASLFASPTVQAQARLMETHIELAGLLGRVSMSGEVQQSSYIAL